MGVEGTGVGLAVSRVLSTEMGGSLTVTSTLGTGSTFTLELPTGHLSAAPEAPADRAHEPGLGEPSVRQVTILAIEDNVVNIRLLERIVQNCENAVLLTAIQGRIGLELAGQHHQDLVLLDLNLPDLSGEEVLERLKAGPGTATIPVVICSGDASDAHRRTCLEAGAAAYLTKPLDLDELYRLVEQARRGEPVEPRPEPSD
jgi:CheY-like chemotaxis protein